MDARLRAVKSRRGGGVVDVGCERGSRHTVRGWGVGVGGLAASAWLVWLAAAVLGVPTWARLPRDQWLASWSKMRDPVVPLSLTLHGHPDAGARWEKH